MTDSASEAKYRHQGEILANRVKKRFKHLRRRFKQQNIGIFRLYDWEIPEIRAVVDWYDGHLVIAEYTRQHSVPQWLPMMGAALAIALDVPMEKVHLKERRVGKRDGKRYERLQQTNARIVMNERDLKFYINPFDYVDTGLFSDHRNTRQMVREMARDRDFLNLYCYTGSFSCYAAKGGARSTMSVDRSDTAITWARENMELNSLDPETNILVQSPTFKFLEQAAVNDQKFDLAVVDPPSFSTSREDNEDFDIVGDHPRLLKAVIKVMRPGSTIFFSTNHQDFSPRMETLPVEKIQEITSRTIPEDYQHKKKTIHRCWQIQI
ncbi:MAG: class I SAM-dependent methyltransferase [Desulfobacterium sp.]|nr:class I SAM-dependent methyltransferase [Desulfobacterium sp.]